MVLAVCGGTSSTCSIGTSSGTRVPRIVAGSGSNRPYTMYCCVTSTTASTTRAYSNLEVRIVRITVAVVIVVESSNADSQPS